MDSITDGIFYLLITGLQYFKPDEQRSAVNRDVPPPFYNIK